MLFNLIFFLAMGCVFGDFLSDAESDLNKLKSVKDIKAYWENYKAKEAMADKVANKIPFGFTKKAFSYSYNNMKGCASYCKVCLHQEDFDQGTISLKTNNVYVCLGEDIEFNPKSNQASSQYPNVKDGKLQSFPSDKYKYSGSDKLSGGPFALGWFSAITVEANGITIDLNKHTLKMHKNFYINQRFFTLIELGVAPFARGGSSTQGGSVGPANFLESNRPNLVTSGTKIKNGILGLTSHHCIHGNSANNVEISDVQLRDFEVGGLQINQFENLKLTDVEVGPSSTQVGVSGYYSSARFTLAAFINKGINKNNGTVPFAYEKRTYKQIFDDLTHVMDIAWRKAINDPNYSKYQNDKLWLKNKFMFESKSGGIPDGSSMYGLIFNNHGVGVFELGQNDNNLKSRDLTLTRVKVHDLRNRVHEVSNMLLDICDNPNKDETETKDTRFSLRDPFGALLNVETIFGENNAGILSQGKFNELIDKTQKHQLSYVGNVLADAKIALGYWGLTKGQQVFSSMNIKGPNGKWNQYNHPFFKWVFNKNEKIEQCANRFQCNGDFMDHSNKGIMGIRIDDVENVQFNEVKVENLHNESPLSSFACKSYRGFHDGGNSNGAEKDFTLKTDVRGISLINTDVRVISSASKNYVSNIISDKGDSIGISVASAAFLSGNLIDVKNQFAANQLSKDELQNVFKKDKIPNPNNFLQCKYIIDEANNAQVQYSQDLIKQYDTCFSAAKKKFCNDDNKIFDKDGNCVEKSYKPPVTDGGHVDTNKLEGCVFKFGGIDSESKKAWESKAYGYGVYKTKQFDEYIEKCQHGNIDVKDCIKYLTVYFPKNGASCKFSYKQTKVCHGHTSTKTKTLYAMKTYEGSKRYTIKHYSRYDITDFDFYGSNLKSSSSSKNYNNYRSDYNKAQLSETQNSNSDVSQNSKFYQKPVFIISVASAAAVLLIILVTVSYCLCKKNKSKENESKLSPLIIASSYRLA